MLLSGDDGARVVGPSSGPGGLKPAPTDDIDDKINSWSWVLVADAQRGHGLCVSNAAALFIL